MVVGVEFQRACECRRSCRLFAEPGPNLAQPKPRRRKGRRRFNRLSKKIGGAGIIPARRQIAAKPVAPVGDNIAR